MDSMLCAGMPVLIVGGFICLVVVILIYNQIHQQRVETAWTEAARDMGLQYHPGAWFRSRKIEGECRGQGVLVDTYTVSHGSGKHRHSTTYMRYRVHLSPTLNLGLKLSQMGFFSRIWTALGGQDIQVGDPRFDEDVRVTGDDPRGVRAFLTPSRRERIHRTLLAYSGCAIKDDQIEWSRRGLETDPHAIQSVLRQFVSLAVHLTGEGVEDLDFEGEARFSGRPAGWPADGPREERPPAPERRRDVPPPPLYGIREVPED